MVDQPELCEPLSDEVRAELVRLLADELAASRRRALDAGARDDQLAEILERRLRMLVRCAEGADPSAAGDTEP